MKKNHSNHSIVLVIYGLSVFWTFISGVAYGGSLNWTNTAGGRWSTAENWEPNQVPGAGDTAISTNSGNYTVTLDSGSYSLEGIVVGGDGGGQRLILAGSQMTCSGTVTVGAGAALNVSQASLQAGEIHVAGILNWN